MANCFIRLLYAPGTVVGMVILMLYYIKRAFLAPNGRIDMQYTVISLLLLILTSGVIHAQELQVIRDVEYAKVDSISLTLDLYLPEKTSSSALPLVVWVHGGAWRAGNKKSGEGAAELLVPAGYVVASVRYRLSQEAKFPAQIHDVKGAIRWLRTHADEYNIDAARIGAWGPSAGGHLVALLGTSADVSKFKIGEIEMDLEGDVGGNTNVSSEVQAVCDYYGPTDFLRMNDFPSDIDHDAADSPESMLIGATIQDHQDLTQLANPISYISANDPPFLIVHGTADPLVAFNQSELLYEALLNAYNSVGKEVSFIPIEGGGHGSFKSPTLPGSVVAFFDRHLK